MKFSYQARTSGGEIRVGFVEASSKDGALTLLQKNGLFVTFLEEESKKPAYAQNVRLFERIKKKEIVILSRQLSVMFRSKIPLIEALNTLEKQTSSGLLKEKLQGLVKEVEGGSALSEAMSKYPKVFSSFYVWMVKAGESSGKLSESFEYLAKHLEKEYEFNEKLKGAMAYPLLIVFIIVLVLLLVIFFVIPQMTSVLEGFGDAQLPAATRFIIALPKFLKSWGWIALVFIAGLIIVGRRYYKTAEGKRNMDKYFLKLIVIGPFLKLIYLARFAENFSTLISAGLPISQALEIVGNIVNNQAFKDVVFDTREGVRKGETISYVLEQNPKLFPPIFTQMVAIGEKTGNLDEILSEMADFYQKETDRGVTNLLKVLEPILIIFLGGVVGGMIAAILLPMYQMMSF
jgi:type IV pilus assembly protein PilC